MYRNVLLWLCLLLAPLNMAIADDKEPAANESAANEPVTKKLSGISIIGNDEVPKSLYIVPWKSSEIGAETNLSRMLNESAMPVDRDVFMRQLDFYEVSTKK